MLYLLLFFWLLFIFLFTLAVVKLSAQGEHEMISALRDHLKNETKSQHAA